MPDLSLKVVFKIKGAFRTITDFINLLYMLFTKFLNPTYLLFQNDCQFSHEAVPPMKLELCKFYLMDCCAKGDKCSYMHSEFPCKFYHTGLNCAQGENCKFAHGKSLSDGRYHILLKL